MDMLKVLEEKIASLITIVQELKLKNEALKSENEQVKIEFQAMQAEHARLVEENAQYVAKLDMFENSVLKGNERMEETKVVVDDLIRSIDALVGNEHQQ
jgi:FtsZ-binding cell division protein ZapB